VVYCYKALVDHSSHDHSDPGSHNRSVWHGLTTLGGLYIFFLLERLIEMCVEGKRRWSKNKLKVARKSNNIYGVSIKTIHLTFDHHNLGKFRPNFKILSLTDSEPLHGLPSHLNYVSTLPCECQIFKTAAELYLYRHN